MSIDLELRLNPRVESPAAGGPVTLRVERLTRRERAVLEPLFPGANGAFRGPAERFGRIPGEVGGLLRETLRRARAPRGARTRIMGILNVTPDSFSDGGDWLDPRRAVRRGRAMLREGADLLDVGGESTRPGARAVSAAEERRRVLPVIERLAGEGALVSVDTSKAAVAEAAFRAGAKILNDVTGLRGDPRLARAAARAGVRVIVMHMKGTPRTMQRNPRYGDVVGEICRSLRKSLKIALRAGIPRDKIIVDPGIGFGKRPEHNMEILRRLDEFRSLGCALAIGTSRKSFIGHYLGRRVDERLPGTAATVAAAIFRGADLIRVHDVREMSDVARMTERLR